MRPGDVAPVAKRPRRTSRHPTVAPAAPPGPFTDPERRAVERNRHTPAYRRAIKQAYKSNPVPVRRAVRQHIEHVPAAKRTPEQRKVLSTHRRYLRAAPQKAIERAYRSQGQQVNEAARHADALGRLHLNPAQQKEARLHPELFLSDVHQLHRLGFKSAGTLEHLVTLPGNLIGSGVAIEEAARHDPFGVAGKTAKQIVAAVPASLGGAVELVRHPAKTAKALGEDILNRTSQSVPQKEKRILKEGALADASDLALAVAPLGGAAREVAGELAVKSLPRAAVRVSGDAYRLERHHGAVRQAIGHAVDQRRGAKLAKDLARAEGGGVPMDPVAHAAAVANRKAGKVVEVPARRTNKAIFNPQHKLVAKARGRAVYRLRTEQHRRLQAAAKSINRLDHEEKRALYYATALGIRTPDQARELLPRLRESIREARNREGVQVTGSLKKSDMLPDIEAILKHPEGHFTRKLGQVVESLRADSIRAGREDPSLKNAKIRMGRRYQPLAQVLGLEKGVRHDLPAEGKVPEPRYFDEGDAAYLKRVAKAAEDKGLARPLYFKSERYVGPSDFAARAVGGKRAMAIDRRMKGRNLELGLQDTRPEQYMRGLARNIKRKHNWNLVADMVEQHALKGFSTPRGTTLAALRERLSRAGVDMNRVGFWDAGAFRAKMAAHKPTDAADHLGEAAEYEQLAVNDAIKKSLVTEKTLTEEDLHKSSRWVAVPVEVLRELERETTPSHPLARALLDIPKGKASRAILLAGNVPWLSFQVASNALVTAAGTGGRIANPKNLVDAYRWWHHDLTPEQRDRVGSMLGMDVTGADSHQIHLGASTTSDLVNTYRAIKAHPMWHTGVAKGKGPSLSQLNPFELMAQADRKQNNVFRVIAGYSKAKQAAVKRMGENMGRTDRAQLKVVSILKKPPAEQLRAIAENPHIMEQHAEAVADWLGDYTTMTATERKVINRAVMFYPYLRYSLRLVFYTLPAKHPTVTAIMAELGQMHAEELRKLFGGDEIFWNSGKIYFGSKGDVKSVDLARANPALNAIWQAAGAKNPGQLMGVAPPYAGWLFDQLYHHNSFADRDWRVHGTAAAYGPKSETYDVATRGRILANSVLSLFYPYRELNRLEINPLKLGHDPRLGGTQGDDSLAFSPRPIKFKGTTSASKLKAAAGKRQQRFNEQHRSLLGEVMPFIPQANRDVAAARDQARIKAADKPGTPGPKPKPFGATGASGHPFGASGGPSKRKPKPFGAGG